MPTPRVCYLQIPAENPRVSADFYATVFDWQTRERGDGVLAFDDGGEVSGAFVTGRPPQDEAGILIYVMVDEAEAAVARIIDAGGTVIAPLGHHTENIALFRDPFGNLLGIYQERA